MKDKLIRDIMMLLNDYIIPGQQFVFRAKLQDILNNYLEIAAKEEQQAQSEWRDKFIKRLKQKLAEREASWSAKYVELLRNEKKAWEDEEDKRLDQARANWQSDLNRLVPPARHVVRR